MFVIVAQSVHGFWNDYYAGKTYQFQREYYPHISNDGRNGARKYSSRKRAEIAAEAIGEKVGRTFIVEELPKAIDPTEILSEAESANLIPKEIKQ